jgi:hypothetical protein
LSFHQAAASFREAGASADGGVISSCVETVTATKN